LSSAPIACRGNVATVTVADIGGKIVQFFHDKKTCEGTGW